MTAYPCTVPIRLHRFAPGGIDAYGNPKPEFTVEDALVFGVALGGEPMVTASHPESVRFDATIFAPVGLSVQDRDRVEYAGVLYEVAEPPGCWDANPWFSPGLVQCQCRRIEG